MKISFIGAGNVAHHLAKRFTLAGHEIYQVLSASSSSSVQFCKEFGGKAIQNLAQLKECDFLLICVPDQKIAEVASGISLRNTTVLHTSGTVSMSVFQNMPYPYGVFYPLQTLNKNTLQEDITIPVCVEGKNPEIAQKIHHLAQQISPQVEHVNSEERQILHLAAVFANNFTNYMLNTAYQIAGEEKKALLKPLILQTFTNALKHSPKDVQTGPAVRKDFETIAKHCELLEKNNPRYLKLYNLVTQTIVKEYE
ncbi:MAG: DUF2520 domain-containing protein [Bacteroidetes bacterium]|nr:MAG: DUF2520 domain-containing protein [Bacteroidota bacterium]